MRARWVGHTLNVVINIEVDGTLTLVQAHTIAEEVRHRLFHQVKGLSEAIIHTDPHSHNEDYGAIPGAPCAAVTKSSCPALGATA